MWEAADLVQQMKQEKVPVDIHTYTSMVNACCKAGDMLVNIYFALSSCYILTSQRKEKNEVYMIDKIHVIFTISQFFMLSKKLRGQQGQSKKWKQLV